MDSHLTLADLTTALARYGLTSADLLRKANRISERLLNSNVFVDLYSIVEFSSSIGHITVPPEYGRIYGVQDQDLPVPVRSTWIEWLTCGIGRQDPANMSLYGLIDEGSDKCTQTDLVDANGDDVPAILRVKIENATDAAKTIRLFGTFIHTDGTERPVLDTTGAPGINLSTLNTTKDTTVVFKKVTGIQAPAMVAPWTLWKVVAGVETKLGVYMPGELRPRYTRYKTRVTTQRLRCYCKRKHVPYVNQTDWIYPANLDAYEFGFEALGYKDRGNLDAEELCWKKAKRVLKEQFAFLRVPGDTYMTSDGFGAPFPGARDTLR